MSKPATSQRKAVSTSTDRARAKQKPARKTSSPDAEKATRSMPASQGWVYRIQEAARIAGMSPTTVRVWERNGLVSSHRGSNGYRYFSEDDLQRLRRIAYLRKEEGLNIEGIRRALEADDSKSAGAATTVSAPSPSSTEVSVGRKLRRLRHEAGFTLSRAAERAELSPSFLSALERDQTGISSRSLHRLSAVYGSTVSTILRTDTTDLVQLSSAGKRTVTQVHGFTVEQLINGRTLLDAMLITLEPSDDPSDAETHAGEEILFVLDGALNVRLGNGQRFKVRPGESLYYPSTIEHQWSNAGSIPVRFLWVVTPPTY